jgi:threonine dehydrogenase-like Zn-dependent dehydrogenase
MGATAITFIALFAAIFGVLYVYYSTRHKERLALIEKGADASLFNTGKEGARSGINWAKFTLKMGMLFMGVALGIIAGAIMSNSGILDENANYPSMIFFFGGLSLVLFYIIDRKNK